VSTASEQAQPPIIEIRGVSKRFTGVEALQNVSLSVHPGEVLCLLGDNGAGKSTVIKVLAGVHQPTEGTILVDGNPIVFRSPRDARALGIATVHQAIGTVPLLSVSRNFFLGQEPTKGKGPLRRFDSKLADRVALEEVRSLGLRRVTRPDQLVGSLSGGERQGVAIARALYFGARVLILDEPTASLGVKEATVVLQLVARARDRGVAVVLVTHNAHHARVIGDRFVVLIHGEVAADFAQGERSYGEIIELMAGGETLEELEVALARGAPQDQDATEA
jgi:simple sugar transport system ATP-binding protein